MPTWPIHFDDNLTVSLSGKRSVMSNEIKGDLVEIKLKVIIKFLLAKSLL